MSGTILIAVGANLPAADGAPPLCACRAAVQAVAAIPGMRLAACSRWYESAPVPPSGQPPYVNGVLACAGAIEPTALLAALHAIEAAAGRERGAVNAARTLDLVIIDMDGMIRLDADPLLPHPRAHLRAFVLRPLADVAPDWIHPRLRQSVRALLDALPPQPIRLLG